MCVLFFSSYNKPSAPFFSLSVNTLPTSKLPGPGCKPFSVFTTQTQSSLPYLTPWTSLFTYFVALSTCVCFHSASFLWLQQNKRSSLEHDSSLKRWWCPLRPGREEEMIHNDLSFCQHAHTHAYTTTHTPARPHARTHTQRESQPEGTIMLLLLRVQPRSSYILLLSLFFVSLQVICTLPSSSPLCFFTINS